MDLREEPVSGGAQRRRQRRLRSWLRHERMTVAMALAERTHHSSRGQTTATRAGKEGYEDLHDAPRRHKPPLPQPELFSLEEEPGGVRPDQLFAVSGPQARVQQRTVQQIVDFAPLPTLDDPAPQMVDQLVDVLKQFDFEVPKQVIEVPMIFLEDLRMRRFRSSLPESQLAGQLVEVPTIISFSSLQRTVEQNVGIPVVGGSGAGGGLSGFLPGHNSFTAEQMLTIQFLGQVLEVFIFTVDRIQQRVAEQINEFPDPGGGQDFQVQGSAVSSSVSPGQAGDGVLRTFPRKKKVRRSRAPRGRNWVRSRAHGRRELG